MRLIRSTDYRRMPWKNGGGETAEIAVWPSGAALDAFVWRLSIARVNGDGPFSSFAGIDRTLAILDGDGLRLSIEGRPIAELTRTSSPYAFPADVATSAVLLGGPVVDLNIMTRRGRVAHRMWRESAEVSVAVHVRTLATLIVCASGRAGVTSSAGEAELGPQDTLLLGQTDPTTRIAAAGGATLLLVEILAQTGAGSSPNPT